MNNNEKIIPFKDRYLIRIHQAASESASGLLMENSSNVAAAPVLGTVIGAGEGSSFKEGDRIFFRRYSIDELKYITEDGEQTVHLVEESEIVAFIRSSD